MRKKSEMLQLFPAYLKGEDLFGLTVSAVARIAESVSARQPGTSRLLVRPGARVVALMVPGGLFSLAWGLAPASFKENKAFVRHRAASLNINTRPGREFTSFRFPPGGKPWQRPVPWPGWLGGPPPSGAGAVRCRTRAHLLPAGC